MLKTSKQKTAENGWRLIDCGNGLTVKVHKDDPWYGDLVKHFVKKEVNDVHKGSKD